MKVKLGEREFSWKKDAVEYIRRILHSHPHNVPIEDPVVFGLLCCHPHASEKIGPGVESIFIRTNSYGNAPGFYVRRVDGSEIDFSYRHCFTPRTRRSDVIKAMRTQIHSQIFEYRDECFNGRCEVTGDSITLEESHVDHESPLFSELVEQFIVEEGITIEEVSVKSVGETVVLLNAEFAQRWEEYHRKYANLRCVSQGYNLKRQYDRKKKAKP